MGYSSNPTDPLELVRKYENGEINEGGHNQKNVNSENKGISSRSAFFSPFRQLLASQQPPIQRLTKPPLPSSIRTAMQYPFLISIPHGGTEVPPLVTDRFALNQQEVAYYSDPATRTLYNFGSAAGAVIDTTVSRMVVDLNRPPLPLPPHDPDGIIKVRTIDGKPVYRPARFPDINLIHRLMMAWYFPYHQRIDDLIDRNGIKIAFDCHSMLPFGSAEQKDAGKKRPLICLGNNGDHRGLAIDGGITTCPEAWIHALAGEFRREFSTEFPEDAIAINNPFSGGFITNAHYWRKGIPWIQIEINRSLYESGEDTDISRELNHEKIGGLREKLWKVLTGFWDHLDHGEQGE
jgi:N-formylglutamate deformylase